MRRSRYVFLAVFLGLTIPGLARPMFAQSGTLMFNLKHYTSDVKIPKNAKKSLEHAGVQWGMLDNDLVISLVNPRYVKADTPYLTRFGEQKTLDLKPGQYTITCIGWEFASTSRNPDKSLAKSAFFNNDVVTFTILPGKTTTLEVSPNFVPESKWYVLSKLTVLTAELKVRVLEDGTPKGDDIAINRRTDKSVAWNDYHGPLKF